MIIRQGLNLSTQDFFYDLFDGGYLNPKKICAEKSDAQKVYDAMNVIYEFRDSIENEYEDFYQ